VRATLRPVLRAVRATLRAVLGAVRATFRPVLRAVRATLRPVLRAVRAVLRAVRFVVAIVFSDSVLMVQQCAFIDSTFLHTLPSHSASQCLFNGAEQRHAHDYA
jgi:hypothetical protein